MKYVNLQRMLSSTLKRFIEIGFMVIATAAEDIRRVLEYSFSVKMQEEKSSRNFL